MRILRRTRDRDNPGPLGHYPGQRELNRSGVFATGPRLREFKQHHVFGQGIGLEAWQVMPPIGAVEPLAWIDCSGEEAAGSRAVRYETDTQLFERWKYSRLVADLIYFMAIARHRSFSRAAIELGVSASALSHALKGLETRLGVRLLNRTTKSVTPTAAGEELVQSVLQPFDTIEGALESLNRYRNTPTGRIRINAAVEAANLLLAPVMPAFMDRYPDIEIDIVASNRMVDVTDAGFDAGIRYGGTVPEDMVARRLSADIRWVIAASPDYLERYGTPEHPDDLLHHRCISNRLGDDRVYRWELARDGETYQMTVPGSVTVNHAETGLVAVLGGAGLMYFPEPLVAPYVKDGRLRLVLTEWSPLEEGFHIYYSSRRQLPTGLRLLIEFIQEARPLGL